MSHIKGAQDRDLHDENGEHIGTAPTTDGRHLERHERRIRAHLEAHRREAEVVKAFEVQSSDVARCPIRSLSARHYRGDGTCLCVKEES